MADSIKTIAERVSDRSGLPIMTNLVGNTNRNAVKILYAIKNAARRDVWRMHNWRDLKRTHTFKYLNGVAAYDLPSDCEPERIIKESVYDRVNLIQIPGPLSLIEWERLQNDLISTSDFDKVWTVKPSSTAFTGTHKVQFWIDPTPSADASIDDSIAFSYTSNLYIADSNSQNLKTNITSDTDIFLIDEEVIEVAAVVRVLRSLRLNYTEEQKEYVDLIRNAISKDSDSIRFSMCADSYEVGISNVPDSGYG